MLENYYITMCANLTFSNRLFHLPLSSVIMAIGNVILFIHDLVNMIQNNKITSILNITQDFPANY